MWFSISNVTPTGPVICAIKSLFTSRISGFVSLGMVNKNIFGCSGGKTHYQNKTVFSLIVALKSRNKNGYQISVDLLISFVC